jgi:hypothetical protein
MAASMLVALAGCAYQDPFELPDLGPAGRSSAPAPYYGPHYGYGLSYGYGYGSGYRPGYDPYYNYYYGGADPRYYGPGVVYVPYPYYVPVPCADANHDGRCDKRPRGDGNDHDGHHHGPNDGQNDDEGNNPDGGKHDGIPRWPGSRNPDGTKGDGPRLRRDVDTERHGAPGMTPRVAPAPTIVQPAPRAVPPTPRPAQVRPPETPRRAAPPPPADRGPRTAPGRSSATVDDGSPPRRPD